MLVARIDYGPLLDMLVSQLKYPELLRKRTGQIRVLRESASLEIRVAFLGGATTQELGSWLDLFVGQHGIRAVGHHGDFGRYFEELTMDAARLEEFAPQVVFLNLGARDLTSTLSPTATAGDLEQAVAASMERVRQVCDAIDRLGALAIVPTIVPPPLHAMGNLSAAIPGGISLYAAHLNIKLAELAQERSRVRLLDAQAVLSSCAEAWYSAERWFRYKIWRSGEAEMRMASSLASIIAAMFGRSRKVLVLDLDNTLWGGVIGDDGVDRLVIGRETPMGEAFTAFQEYCRALQRRGVLLAVCSKNDDAIARSGFEHPDSVLKLTDFAAFRANWEPKSDNLLSIAAELNLGIDSFVFIDDNPAERHLVSQQLPAVAVPDVGNDPAEYCRIIEEGRYFEPVSISNEDVQRAAMYAANSVRNSAEAAFANYDEYLQSLAMVAEIDAFQPVYIERIAQLINKTNQFNLTTRRYTLAEVQELAQRPNQITLYGRLADRFGDNGLVSVIIGRAVDRILYVDLWLMSCRVLKRGFEQAMFDALVDRARQLGCTELVGTYIPTDKNGMVAGHYASFGFTRTTADYVSEQQWHRALSDIVPTSKHIKVRTHERYS
jgi:FkbH-like protein